MTVAQGFQFDKAVGLGTDKYQRKQIAPSQTFTRFMACKLDADGRVTPIAAATDQATHIFQTPTFPSLVTTATDLQMANVCEITRELIYIIPFVPILNGAGAVTGSTSTSLIVPMAAATTNDLIGAVLLHRPSNSQRIVTGNTYSTISTVPCVTLTFIEPLGAPDPTCRPVYPNTGDPTPAYTAYTPAVGDLVDLVPFGPLHTAVKYDATLLGQGISVAYGGQTGGTIKIESVDMKLRQARVRLLAP